MSLRYEVRNSTKDEDAPLIVLLHGRGASRFDLLGLTDHFPASATIVFPEAPFDAARWGYGAGSAWYRFLQRNKPEPDSFASSLKQLHDFVAQFKRGKVVLGGFSQGGTMSIAYALAHPGEIAGVINFSGFLADHPLVKVHKAEGTRFFWGHGMHDPAIPFDLAIEGRKLLRDAGADVTSHDYSIGHWIDPQELEDATNWLDGIL